MANISDLKKVIIFNQEYKIKSTAPDEYIQEILDGFDVSSVLVNKDSEYLKFKEEIKEKSQIRQILGDTSEIVLDLFEKWWDKYGTSLNQIDAELKEAESMMHESLRNLGYE